MGSGSLDLFVSAKLAVAIAAACLTGAVLSWAGPVSRDLSNEELERVSDVIAGCLLDGGAMPSLAALERSLPPVGQEFEVRVRGELSGGQSVIIEVAGRTVVRRCMVLPFTVNSGFFTIRSVNPRAVVIRRKESLEMELVG